MDTSFKPGFFDDAPKQPRTDLFKGKLYYFNPKKINFKKYKDRFDVIKREKKGNDV